MRAFHCSWWSFFIAFFIWFSAAPLLSEIKDDLGLTKQQVWNSSIAGVGSTIFMRFVNGPLCDKYGPRVMMSIILFLACIPTALTGTVQNATDLVLVRLFIGLGGSTFVMCQYWTSRQFTKEVVGTANALVGGWGNLGGGVTQLVIGSLLFPLLKAIYSDDADCDPDAIPAIGQCASEKAWRTVCVIPAFFTALTAWWILGHSDDAPKGNYYELKENGAMPNISATNSFREGAYNVNTWILFVQYACCFGVELTMNNAAALYFKEEFDQTTESAAAIASLFGWMNLFARGLGGYFSDKGNAKAGMKGRLIVQSVCLFFEGFLVLVFAQSTELWVAILIMVIFSLFVQAAEGSSYGIVPYINPPVTGSIAGIVGAGGNTGAVCFGMCFRELDYKAAFMIMGFCILGTSLLSPLVRIPGQNTLLLPPVQGSAPEVLTAPKVDEEEAQA
jgi:NNP family nitrate/nitrite transporter-like MFS transporter